MFLLDEFGNYTIPDYDLIITTGRKYLINQCMIFQNKNQLESRYSKSIAETIFSNTGAKLYFGAGIDIQTASSLANELGQYSYTENDRSMTRILRSSSEIRQLSADQAILLYGNLPPTILRLRPYFEQPLLMKRVSCGSYNPVSDIPNEPIPLLMNP
jgi:type IV secretory pathway TraG/TraD family ATPase VirD4